MNDSNLSSQTLRKLLSYKSTVYIIFCTKRWKLTETYSLWSNNFNDMCKMLCTLFITNFSSFFLSSFRAASRSNFNIMWNDPTQKPITKYFILHDLWLSFEKWSAYGAKTKVIANREVVDQFFVRSLSAIQIFTNKPYESVRYNRLDICDFKLISTVSFCTNCYMLDINDIMQIKLT